MGIADSIALLSMAGPYQAGQVAPAISRAEVAAIDADGRVIVHSPDSPDRLCDVLLSTGVPSLSAGDAVLVIAASNPSELPVVLGRVGRCTPPPPLAHVVLEAAQSMTLRCGEASIDLRADGKVVIRGEDVLLRAKGTQRIRAGTVSIN